MEFLRYHYENGWWYPPRDANLGEILNGIVSAGRGIDFDMERTMPHSYAIYRRFEDKYQKKTGRIAHIQHKLNNKEYLLVVQELERVLQDDPCDREWMK